MLCCRGMTHPDLPPDAPPPIRPRRWYQLSLVEVLVLMNIAGLLIVGIAPRMAEARRRANTRACYANQKTLAGAVEMFNLDNMTVMEPPLAANLPILLERGYMQGELTDPGMGPDSSGNYEMAEVGGMGTMTCRTHGPIQDRSAP